MLKALYLSSMLSQEAIDYIFSISERKPSPAAQKFHKLLAAGLARADTEVACISCVPMTRAASKRWVFSLPNDTEDGLRFVYPAFLNCPGLKQLCLAASTLQNGIRWGRQSTQPKVIICDVLNPLLSVLGLLMGRVMRCPVIGIVTDIPSILAGNRAGIIVRLPMMLSEFALRRCDGYLLMTKPMAEKMQIQDKPCLIMEGLVDANDSRAMTADAEKAQPFTLLYAGSLDACHGIGLLLDAVAALPAANLNLWIYGAGDMREEIARRAAADSRIVFHGMVANQTVMDAQARASLLVNPRPASAEFTKYSFPSKTMEYMASGTPVLMMRLPGMPEDYVEHVYLIERESPEGVAEALSAVLGKSPEELREKGAGAKAFVLERKNHVAQGRVFREFLNRVAGFAEPRN